MPEMTAYDPFETRGVKCGDFGEAFSPSAAKWPSSNSLDVARKIAARGLRICSSQRKAVHMERFPVHTLDSAPEASKSALRDVHARFGLIPNLASAMATSPVLIQSFIGIFDKVHGGSFTEPEIQTVLLTDAVTNACAWAVALHSALALQAGLVPADVAAMRAGRSPSDSKLGALSTLARTLIEERGRLDDQDIESFLAAGFGKDLLLEAITIVAASTITNYTGNVTNPPLEAALQAQAWES
jgi:alkylhydroperoxidase family enzyme